MFVCVKRNAVCSVWRVRRMQRMGQNKTRIARNAPQHDGRQFYFSSNRNSKGKEFDIVSANSGFLFNKKSKSFLSGTTVNGVVGGNGIGGIGFYKILQLSKLLQVVNTSEYNELGPYGYTKQSSNYGYFKHYLIYSNDDSRTRDMNVKFAYIEGKHEAPYGDRSGVPSILSLKGNVPANLLNSDSNDAYPSIDDVNGIIYFCSDRGGKFQI